MSGNVVPGLEGKGGGDERSRRLTGAVWLPLLLVCSYIMRQARQSGLHEGKYQTPALGGDRYQLVCVGRMTSGSQGQTWLTTKSRKGVARLMMIAAEGLVSGKIGRRRRVTRVTRRTGRPPKKRGRWWRTETRGWRACSSYSRTKCRRGRSTLGSGGEPERKMQRQGRGRERWSRAPAGVPCLCGRCLLAWPWGLGCALQQQWCPHSAMHAAANSSGTRPLTFRVPTYLPRPARLPGCQAARPVALGAPSRRVCRSDRVQSCPFCLDYTRAISRSSIERWDKIGRWSQV